MSAIYLFFASLIANRTVFLSDQPLEALPYEDRLIAARSQGQFPDMVLRLNNDGTVMAGGELIELKDSSSGYSVPSFNSTIPTGSKAIETLGGDILRQIRSHGEQPDALPIRDVYYLMRGRKRGKVKVCLTHGSFFETIPTEELIREAFLKVLDDRLTELDQETKASIASVFTEREAFSQTRDVKNASVKLRFRVMTEVKPEGNPLNPGYYPQIRDDTLNLIIPIRRSGDAHRAVDKFCAALGYPTQIHFHAGAIKHPFNGRFIVFQCPLI
jgi:hypothetical protein